MEHYVLDAEAYTSSAVSEALDFAEVLGQRAVTRAITIAAAGQHNILIIGPRGRVAFTARSAADLTSPAAVLRAELALQDAQYRRELNRLRRTIRVPTL